MRNFTTSKTKTVPPAWLYANTQWDLVGGSGSRLRYRSLGAKEKAGLRRAANEDYFREVGILRDEVLALKEANRRIEERHIRELETQSLLMQRRHDREVAHMQEKFKAERGSLETSIARRDAHIERLKRTIASREALAASLERGVGVVKAEGERAKEMLKEKEGKLKAVRVDRDIIKSNAKREKRKLQAELEKAASALERTSSELSEYATCLDDVRTREAELAEEAMLQEKRHSEWNVFSNVDNKDQRNFTYDFERHTRRLLSSGVSSKACGEILQLHADYLLKTGGKGEVKNLIRIPHKRWYDKQREAVGAEAWLWSMIQIAGADTVLQFGCDETSIDRTATFTQWVLIETNGVTSLITMEAGRLLAGSTAEEIKAHIKESWRRGKVAVEMVLGYTEIGPGA